MGTNPFEDDELDPCPSRLNLRGGRAMQKGASTNPFDDSDEGENRETSTTNGNPGRFVGGGAGSSNPFDDASDDEDFGVESSVGATERTQGAERLSIAATTNPFDDDDSTDAVVMRIITSSANDTRRSRASSSTATRESERGNPFDTPDEKDEEGSESQPLPRRRQQQQQRQQKQREDKPPRQTWHSTLTSPASSDASAETSDVQPAKPKLARQQENTAKMASMQTKNDSGTSDGQQRLRPGMATASESMRKVKATFSRLGGKTVRGEAGADGDERDEGAEDMASGGDAAAHVRESHPRHDRGNRMEMRQSSARQQPMATQMYAQEADGDLESQFQADAVREVMLMLPSVEVLRFLPKLQATVNARVTSTESELQMMARSQVEEAHAVLNLLSESLKTSRTLSIAMTKLIDTLGTCTSLFNEEDPKSLMTQLSIANLSLRRLAELCDAILTFPYEAEEVEAMIEIDGDLVNAHEALVGLQFHAEALDRAAFLSIKGDHNVPDRLDSSGSHPFADFEEGGRQQYEIVRSFLERLSQTNAVFESALFEHFTDMDSLAKREPSLLVRAIRIVEKQELIDTRLVKMKKNYKEKAFSTVKEALQTKFSVLVKTFKTKNSDAIILLLESMTIGLTNTYDFVVPCFPQSYRIFEFILSEYDRHYTRMFADFCRRDGGGGDDDDEPSPSSLSSAGVPSMFESFSNGDIKRLLMWLKDYQDQQTSLGIVKTFLGAVLEESRLGDLVRFDTKQRVKNGASSETVTANGGGAAETATMTATTTDGRTRSAVELDAAPDGAASGGDAAHDDDGSSVATMSIADILSKDRSVSVAATASLNGGGDANADRDVAHDLDWTALHRSGSGSSAIGADDLQASSSAAASPSGAAGFSDAERGFLTMIDVYVGRMQQLLSTWFSNLLVIDSGTIPKRSETTGKLYTPASVEIFGIIDDQIAVVTDVDKSWWLYKVIDAVLTVMDSFQSRFHEGLGKLESQGFESCIAGINNAVRCYEYAQDLSEQVEQILPLNLFDLLDFESTYTRFLNTAKGRHPPRFELRLQGHRLPPGAQAALQGGRLVPRRRHGDHRGDAEGLL